MMTTLMPLPIAPNARPEVSLHQVLRCHSLGELQNCDAHDLKKFKEVLTGQIQAAHYIITSTNQFFSKVIELRADLRWYVIIETEIDALLAAEFHAK